MTKTNCSAFEILNFGHCYLFDICDLLFGIYTTPKEVQFPLKSQKGIGALKFKTIENQSIFLIPLIA